MGERGVGAGAVDMRDRRVRALGACGRRHALRRARGCSPHNPGFQTVILSGFPGYALYGWIEHIPGETRQNDGLETGLGEGSRMPAELPLEGSRLRGRQGAVSTRILG